MDWLMDLAILAGLEVMAGTTVERPLRLGSVYDEITPLLWPRSKVSSTCQTLADGLIDNGRRQVKPCGDQGDRLLLLATAERLPDRYWDKEASGKETSILSPPLLSLLPSLSFPFKNLYLSHHACKFHSCEQVKHKALSRSLFFIYTRKIWAFANLY